MPSLWRAGQALCQLSSILSLGLCLGFCSPAGNSNTGHISYLSVAVIKDMTKSTYGRLCLDSQLQLSRHAGWAWEAACDRSGELDAHVLNSKTKAEKADWTKWGLCSTLKARPLQPGCLT